MGADTEPAKAVAAVGSTIGAFTLTFMSLFLVNAAPLGTAPRR